MINDIYQLTKTNRYGVDATIHVYLILYQFRLKILEQYSHYNLNYRVNDFDLLARKPQKA